MIASEKLFLEYVDSSPTARRLLWHLYSISRLRWEGISTTVPFAKPGAGVVWVTHGHGQIRIEGRLFEFAPGSFWLFSAAHTRQFITTAGGAFTTEGFWFAGSGLDSWLRLLDIDNQPQFRVSNPQVVFTAYRRMISLVRKRPPEWELTVHHMLASVLDEFLKTRELLMPRENVLPEPIAKALNAIGSDPLKDWNANELGRIAGMGRSAFNSMFKKTMGESPHAYISSVRVNMARELLMNPELRIKEIAARLRFSSKYYFSHFFHRHTGLSPIQFREISLRSASHRTG